METLWTPWRSTYLKTKGESGSCIFCKAAAGDKDEESLVVHRAEHCFVILNRYPYTSGHVMIAPYAHVSRLTAIPDAAAFEMMHLMRQAQAVIERTYQPGGLNLGMNLGEAAGAGIEQHIHMHVLPRWRGDANFMTSIGEVRVIPEDLDVTYQRIRSAFQELRDEAK